MNENNQNAIEKKVAEIDLMEPEPYRSSVTIFTEDLEKTRDFYNFLQGKRDSFERLQLTKYFTPEQAFRIIDMLRCSKRFNFIPEWVEQCDICKKLYDLEKEGGSTECCFDSTVGMIQGLNKEQHHHLFVYVNSFFDDGNINFCGDHKFAWTKSLLIFLKNATERLYPFAVGSTNWTEIESEMNKKP